MPKRSAKETKANEEQAKRRISMRLRGEDDEEERRGPPPTEFAGKYFVRHFPDFGCFKGTARATLFGQHEITGADLYEVEYEDGDMEDITYEEVKQLLAKNPAPAPTSVELRQWGKNTAGSIPPPGTEAARKATPQRASKVTKPPTSDAADKADTADQEPAASPKSPRKRKAPVSSSKPGSSRRKTTKSSKKEVEADADADEDAAYKVESLLDKKYAKKAYYKVRWAGDWPKHLKETWEPEENIHPNLVTAYEKAHKGDNVEAEVVDVNAYEKLKEQYAEVAAHLRRVLSFMEHPSWRETDKAVDKFDDDDMPAFPLDEFIDYYRYHLQERYMERLAKDTEDFRERASKAEAELEKLKKGKAN